MYLDVVIVLALIVLAFCWFRTFSKTVYAIAIIDIFLRLLHYISANVGIPGFYSWVRSIFPSSIPDILMWVYVFFMVVFLFYVTRTFIRKK